MHAVKYDICIACKERVSPFQDNAVFSIKLARLIITTKILPLPWFGIKVHYSSEVC